jgi:hypothetical protein
MLPHSDYNHEYSEPGADQRRGYKVSSRHPYSCSPTANVTIVAIITDEVTAWKADMAVLKRKDKQSTGRKDNIKEILERLTEHSKILEWITTSKDYKVPEPSQEEIMNRTGMDDENYANAGEWFLSSSFRIWLDGLDTATATKRFLWLKGTSKDSKITCSAVLTRFAVGTGKTTLTSVTETRHART